MKYEYLVFDLDGTISDPRDGIVRSINYALESYGFGCRAENELCSFIGPPLDVAFAALTGSDDGTLIKSLVTKYRERYSDVGYSENALYEGISDVLSRLSSIEELKLVLCTSKRVDFAERILELFSLREHFCFVSGGDVGIEKWQQLEELLKQGKINSKSVMIGDRFIDVTAAQKNELDSAAVLWGYGSHIELSQHNPSHIFSSPSELLGLVA